MPLDFFLNIIGMPMDHNFAVALIVIAAFVALIVLAAKLVTKRADRIERKRQEEEFRRGTIDAAKTMLRPMPAYKGERREHLNPLHAAPYGAERSGLHQPARKRRDDDSRSSSSDLGDVLLAGVVLHSISSGPATGRISSSDDTVSQVPKPTDEIPYGTHLDDIKTAGSYTAPKVTDNWPSSRSDDSDSITRSSSFSSSPSFSNNDSYSSSDSYGSSSSYDSSSSSSFD